MCKGTAGFVHQECIREWIQTKGSDDCEICKTLFFKEEHCSFEPHKYCVGCVTCDTENTLVLTAVSTIWITVVMGAILSYTEMSKYILIVSVANVSAMVCAIIWGIFYRKSIHNVILYWKMAVTIPFMATCLVQYMSIENDCENSCRVFLQACSDTCPLFDVYTTLEDQLDKAVLFDTSNIFIILVVRAIALCFIYMRNVTLRDRPDDMERLLDDDNEERLC
jgi:hypothetical protein